MEPQTVNLGPKWVQKTQDGGKRAKTELEDRFFSIWGPPGYEKVVPFGTQNGTKIDQTINKH